MKWIVLVILIVFVFSLIIGLLDMFLASAVRRGRILRGYAKVRGIVVPFASRERTRALKILRRKGLVKLRLTGPRGEDTTLEKLLEQVPKGWRQLVTRLVTDLSATGLWDGYVRKLDIKLGILEFWTSKGAPTELQETIYKAVEESAKICDQCGKPGRVAGKHELRARCDEHREEEA